MVNGGDESDFQNGCRGAMLLYGTSFLASSLDSATGGRPAR